MEQVFYIEDLKMGRNWYVVERFGPRNCYDVPEHVDKEAVVEKIYQEEAQGGIQYYNRSR